MVERIFIIACVAAACIYGAVQIHRGTKNRYFLVAVCGMAALLLSRLYYFILILAGGNDQILTVGTFGQASAYLFFLTGNVLFVSRDMMAESRKKLCIPGLLGTLQLCALFLLAAIRIHSVSAWIGELICMVYMGSSFYYAVNTLSYRNRITQAKDVAVFNVCVCILAESNGLIELLNTFANCAVTTACYIAIVVISCLAILAMLPMLRKGMASWET